MAAPLLLLAGFYVQMVVHELGHAAAALIAGFPLRELRFGTHSRGRHIGTLRGVRIVVGPKFAGLTRYTYDDRPHLLARARFVIVAGPGANLAFAPLALLGNMPVHEFGVAALLLGMANLLPYRTKAHTSDGLNLIKSRSRVAPWAAGAALRAAVAESDRTARDYTPDQAERLLDDVRRHAAQPATGAAWIPLLVRVATDAGALRHEFPLVREHLSRPPLAPAGRAWMANNVAWELLCNDKGRNYSTDPESLRIADFCSGLAVELHPSCATLHTRAEVLRRLGRFDEALPIAQHALSLVPADLAPSERDRVVATLVAIRHRDGSFAADLAPFTG